MEFHKRKIKRRERNTMNNNNNNKKLGVNKS